MLYGTCFTGQVPEPQWLRAGFQLKCMTFPPPLLSEILSILAYDMLYDAFTAGTLAIYNKRWAHFSHFVRTTLLECPHPAEENTILKYVASLHKGGAAASTIRSAVAVLVWKHKISALADPTKGYRLMKVLKNLQKITPKKEK